MRTLITAQQAAFFAQNGYIELEGIPFDPDQIFSSAKSVLEGRAQCLLSRTPSPRLYQLGRDLWRESAILQTFLQKPLAKIALNLIDRPLRIACDQWIPSDYPWTEKAPFKGMFSIQGLAIGAILCSQEITSPDRAPLGLLPIPKNPNSILFFKPELIIDWPSLAKMHCADLYFASFAYSTAVYIHNPKDPSGNALKQMGYHFGDSLQNHSHPVLFPS